MQILEHELKNSKAEILATSWQPVGNLCEIGNQLATSWQPLRNWQTFGNQFATIAKFASHIAHHIAKFASHIKLQKLSEISHCQLRKPHCQIRKPIAKFAIPLPNSQSPCQIRNPLRNSQRLRTHCEVFAKFSIFAHCFALRFCFAHNFFIRTPF